MSDPYSDIDQMSVRTVIESALRRLNRATAANTLRKQLPRSYQIPLEELKKHLDELVRAGAIHKWQPDQTIYYAAFDPEAAARRQMLAAMAGRRLSARELAVKVKGLPGYSKTQKYVKEHLKPVLATGQAFLHPPAGREKIARYAIEPPPPGPYLTKIVKEIQAVGLKLNQPLETVYQALRPMLGLSFPKPLQPPPPETGTLVRSHQEPERLILAGMVKIEPKARQRALVSLRDLRRSVDLSKEQFDKTVLDLARTGKVVLHYHDYPSSLSETEREELVRDSLGTYYIGIVLGEGHESS
ncbi:MAG: hypothetical protein AB1641_15035 [Thermodesulfobacteriota bacterium]